GYAGEAYWGRYFWDTEMFLLPFYLYTNPVRARTLVDFRVQSLAGAKENANRYGYPGARSAWESDAEGRECCPNWQYADHEVHVTADVVYGLAHYAHATGNMDYLRGPAAEVILETARYWMARLDWREGDGYPSLLGVMGPDEYTPISNNNSYTNRMVAFALKTAAEIGPCAGASPSECEAFAAAAASLPIPRDKDGLLVLQCEGFDRLADARFDELWRDRDTTFAAQVSQERLYRCKCLKQADVLMLMMLFPGEFSDAEVRRAWDYYLPLTTHDSSLSAGVHAIVATRLKLMDEAWRFWMRARAIDLDVEHGGAAEGIHIANAGAVWQMLVLGFAGMRTAMQAEMLTLMPSLPAAWSRLAFPVVWQGQPVYVEIEPEEVRIANRGSAPLEVQIHDDRRVIAAQACGTWQRRTQSKR
ncbi:MAG TPA: glycosyl hydrolase family 65 protein, partial [Phycisphaerae bacterium]|nr:glycosyl hydrolase family 65 protein [Phycisphaerae bacterium]